MLFRVQRIYTLQSFGVRTPSTVFRATFRVWANAAGDSSSERHVDSTEFGRSLDIHVAYLERIINKISALGKKSEGIDHWA